MLKAKNWFLYILVFISGISHVQAENMYITDRVLLGVHADPSEESPLIDSVPSGTSVEVLETKQSFKRVRLPNGKTGWASSSYLMNEKPATAKYDELLAKQKKAEASLKAIQTKLANKEKELQVRSDELSNARTTINSLKKKEPNTAPPVDTKMAEELATANQEIENLKQQLAKQKIELTQPQSPSSAPVNESEMAMQLARLEKENAVLQGRIEMVRASLDGESVPTVEEMAMVRPRMPGWYWGLLVLMVIVGVIAGVSWMDYRNRQRHGGFRI